MHNILYRPAIFCQPKTNNYAVKHNLFISNGGFSYLHNSSIRILTYFASSQPKTLLDHLTKHLKLLKDMLEILFRLLEGENARQEINKEWKEKKGKWIWAYKIEFRRGKERYKEPKKEVAEETESRIEANEAKLSGESEKGSILRKEKQMARTNKFQDLYESDVCFRFLYEKILSFFADMLKADMELFNFGKMGHIILAAKRCPSLDSSFDKCTLIS